MFQNSEIKEEDYSRIAELYNKLYIQKYSIYNPQYNEKYIKLTHQKKLIEYFGLKNNNGILDGILGCYDRGNITTTPIVGYETDLPQKIGLYRMLTAYRANRANSKNLILNASSGASGFKILRGGITYIKYSAAYIGHLKLLPKIIWKSLSYLLRYIIVLIMKIYKL